jgi:hypothetical protein
MSRRHAGQSRADASSKSGTVAKRLWRNPTCISWVTFSRQKILADEPFHHNSRHLSVSPTPDPLLMWRLSYWRRRSGPTQSLLAEWERECSFVREEAGHAHLEPAIPAIRREEEGIVV